MDEIILNEQAIEAADTPTESENTPSVLGDEDIWGFDTAAETAESEDDSTDSEAEEANQPNGEAEDKAEGTDGTQEDEDTPDFLPVTFNHEDMKLSKKEAQTYAQKGMNYDKVRSQLDNANAEVQRYKQYEQFLNEIKGDFATINELMVDTRARMLIDAEKNKGNTITYENAAASVRERMPKPIDAKKLQADLAVKAFKSVYGDMKADEIPQEVWDDVKVTGDLIGAYHNYEKRTFENRIKELEKENASLKQQNKNSARKIGGSKSAGNGNSYKAYLDKIWDDA